MRQCKGVTVTKSLGSKEIPVPCSRIKSLVMPRMLMWLIFRGGLGGSKPVSNFIMQAAHVLFCKI